MLKQFRTFIHERRDFYYPRFIGSLSFSLFGILFARVMEHQMLDWMLILCGVIMPLTMILTPFIQWLIEYKSNKKAVKQVELDEIMPWGENYLSENRMVLDEETQMALDALNVYDASCKSAQDAAHLINQMSKIYKSK